MVIIPGGHQRWVVNKLMSRESPSIVLGGSSYDIEDEHVG